MKFIKQLIKNIIKIYPRPLRKFFQQSSILIKQQRFIHGEKVDGSYDIETGNVILWEPNFKDQEGLFLIITHEWGHKIYHEWLTHQDIEEWLFVRSLEKIDFDINKTYPVVKQPEEEFCTVFSLVSLVKYWSKNNMKTQSKKLASKLNAEFPIASRIIEKYIKKTTKSSHKSDYNITHREVENLKKWVHKIIGE